MLTSFGWAPGEASTYTRGVGWRPKQVNPQHTHAHAHTEVDFFFFFLDRILFSLYIQQFFLPDGTGCINCMTSVRRVDVQAEAGVPGDVPLQGAPHHVRDALFPPQRGRARQHLSRHLEREVVVGVQRQHHLAVPPVFASW